MSGRLSSSALPLVISECTKSSSDAMHTRADVMHILTDALYTLTDALYTLTDALYTLLDDCSQRIRLLMISGSADDANRQRIALDTFDGR